jgi:protein-tyrosine-phosphatase
MRLVEEMMKRVVFIDVRNATRSQIAETWFNHLADGSGEAYSCGTMPANKVDLRAIKVMREVGLKIHTHTPKLVSQHALASADLIVLMGTDINPRAFSPTHIWDFDDLAGKPLEDVRTLRDKIHVRVQNLLTGIRATEELIVPSGKLRHLELSHTFV